MPRASRKKGRHAARVPERGEILLAWALDRDGHKTPIGSLDATTRRELAPFSCLACGEPLVAKLGQVRARHFAHRPGSSCPLTNSEKALHLNAKERLLFLCGEAFAGKKRSARAPAMSPSE